MIHGPIREVSCLSMHSTDSQQAKRSEISVPHHGHFRVRQRFHQSFSLCHMSQV